MCLDKYLFCNLLLFKVYMNIRKMLQNSDTEIPRKQLNPLCHTFADLVKFFVLNLILSDLPTLCQMFSTT